MCTLHIGFQMEWKCGIFQNATLGFGLGLVIFSFGLQCNILVWDGHAFKILVLKDYVIFYFGTHSMRPRTESTCVGSMEPHASVAFPCCQRLRHTRPRSPTLSRWSH